MFEAVAIDREYFDPGALAEAMVYFGRVDLTVGRGHFERLVEALTPPQLIRSLENGHLHLHFFDSRPAAPNLIAADGRPAFHLDIISMAGYGDLVRWHTPREVMIESYLRRFGITKANRAFLERVAQHVTFESGEVLTSASTLDELHHSEIVPDLATTYFREFYPGADLSDLKFRREMVPNHGMGRPEVPALVADTQFVFDAPGDGARPNAANFAVELLELNTIIKKSAAANTDIWLKPQASNLLSTKITALERLGSENARQIGDFESVVLDKLSFRQMINDGSLSFAQLLDLIEHEDTRKMKAWLREQKPGRNIVTEYHKVIFAKEPKLTPIQRAVKIVIWEGLSAGVVNVLTGGLAPMLQPIASSVASIALDQAEAAGAKAVAKAFSKWTPREWVDGVVRPLSDN
jgi:hypothetical protein